MLTSATFDTQNMQSNAAFLGQVIDQMIGIIKTPQQGQPSHHSFSSLKTAFETADSLPKSLLVVRVENDHSEVEKDAAARLTQQAFIAQQLQSTCGRYTHAAPIGEQEYAILLLGIEQCSELIPKIENLRSRTAAGHLNGDGASLDCRVGVARCPIDTYELNELIRMASNAATELRHSELGYQFVSRRHRQIF